MKKYKAYKIIIALVFAIVTILSSIMLGDIIISERNIGTPFALVVWLALAIPSFAVAMIMSLIGTIISAIKKKQGLCDTKTLVYFIVFTALPIVVFCVSIVLFNILI